MNCLLIEMETTDNLKNKKESMMRTQFESMQEVVEYTGYSFKKLTGLLVAGRLVNHSDRKTEKGNMTYLFIKAEVDRMLKNEAKLQEKRAKRTISGRYNRYIEEWHKLINLPYQIENENELEKAVKIQRQKVLNYKKMWLDAGGVSLDGESTKWGNVEIIN